LIFAIPGFFFINFAAPIVGWVVQVAVYAFGVAIPSFLLQSVDRQLPVHVTHLGTLVQYLNMCPYC
jgi:hypothetical protein